MAFSQNSSLIKLCDVEMEYCCICMVSLVQQLGVTQDSLQEANTFLILINSEGLPSGVRPFWRLIEHFSPPSHCGGGLAGQGSILFVHSNRCKNRETAKAGK